MKRVNILILSIILIVFSCKDKNTSSPDTGMTIENIVKTEWRNYKSSNNIPVGGLAIKIITKNNSYFYSTDFEQDITENIHFRIASCTKTFTAASIMLLHQQGKLNIDSTITALIPGNSEPYVPDIPVYNIPFKNEITIRMLLEHRAGIFDVTNSIIPDSISQPYAGESYLDYILVTEGPYHQYSFDELIGVVAENQLYYFKPDEDYHYSNTGFSILGKIIERVAAKTYSDFIHDELFVPNELTNTSSVFESTDHGLPEPFVEGYLIFQGELEKNYLDNMSKNIAEGNIISTPLNLATWIWSLFHGEAGPNTQTVAMMMDCKPTGLFYEYGLGIAHVEGVGYGHDGGHLSYITKAVYDPEADIAIAMFTNLMNADSLYQELDAMTEIIIKVKNELR